MMARLGDSDDVIGKVSNLLNNPAYHTLTGFTMARFLCFWLRLLTVRFCLTSLKVGCVSAVANTTRSLNHVLYDISFTSQTLHLMILFQMIHHVSLCS